MNSKQSIIVQHVHASNTDNAIGPFPQTVEASKAAWGGQPRLAGGAMEALVVLGELYLKYFYNY